MESVRVVRAASILSSWDWMVLFMVGEREGQLRRWKERRRPGRGADWDEEEVIENVAKRPRSDTMRLCGRADQHSLADEILASLPRPLRASRVNV